MDWGLVGTATGASALAGLATALGIGIQNVPEGLAVAVASAAYSRGFA